MSENEVRVKLFCLDNFGRWEDKGIGFVTKENNKIEINSEVSDETLLHFMIDKITAFRQSDTIIQWSDGNSKNYALSFQHIESANMFWELFQEFLSDDSLVDCNLPEPTVENVEGIVKILQDDEGTKNINTSWISDLCRNALESVKISQFFLVFKELINLAKFEVFEALLTDENFVALFKSLDTDKDRSFTANFSKYFEESKFVNLLEINDEGLLRKIHFAHRLLCLKENLMSKSFKEYTIQCICNFHLVIWNQIILDVISLSGLRASLLSLLKKPDFNAFLILAELFQNSRFISPNTRNQFYVLLKNEGFFLAIQKGWFSKSANIMKIRRIIIDIFVYISYLNTSMILECFLENQEKLFVRIFKSSFEAEAEIMQKSSELIKMVFTAENSLSYPQLFQEFYNSIFPFLLSKLSSRYLKNDSVDVAVEILQVYSDCISKVPEPMNRFILAKGVIPILSSLIKNSKKEIKIASIKLLKLITQNLTEETSKELLNSNIFVNIFQCFKENLSSEGMIFSSILSLCKEIKQLPSSSLKRHVQETLNAFDLPLITSILQDNFPLPALEIRRSRGLSFELIATEVFVDSDKNSPTISPEVDSGKVLGKRFSDCAKSPEKRPDRKAE